MASRSLDPEESDLHAFPLARDGVCMIVHRDNPIVELTEAQIVAIYTGKISNWEEVGGKSAPITVVHKAEGRATLEVFLKHFRLDNRAVHPDVVIGDNEQAIKTVAGNPDALAYVSIGTASFEARHGTPIRLLPLGGVPADLAHVADGSFPMGRILNFVSAEEPRGLVLDFLDFARSAAVDDLVTREAFVPLPH